SSWTLCLLVDKFYYRPCAECPGGEVTADHAATRERKGLPARRQTVLSVSGVDTLPFVGVAALGAHPPGRRPGGIVLQVVGLDKAAVGLAETVRASDPLAQVARCTES